jgi:DNA modification methylase
LTWEIREGHVLDRLREMADNSVDCVVTSPPYWGLRDYGIEPQVWENIEDSEHLCKHEWETEIVEREMRRGINLADSSANTRGGAKKVATVPHQRFEMGDCRHCFAWRGSFGLEPTPELYIKHAVWIFEEVRRVLKPQGTLWLNIGDCYAAGGGEVPDYRGTRLPNGRGDSPAICRVKTRATRDGSHAGKNTAMAATGVMEQPNRRPLAGLKPKDLVGIPWMLAFALRNAGWYLRQDIIWNKPNPMPESVRDRCTKAHEYIFLLSKSRRYYFDAEAIAEEVTGNAHARGTGVNPKAQKWVSGWAAGNESHDTLAFNSTQADKVGKLHSARAPRPKQNESFSAAVTGLVEMRNKRSVWPIATEAFTEAHFATFPTELARNCIVAGCPEGGTVLDPFNGAGTTGLVAVRYHRKYLGIELKAEYAEMARRRIADDRPLLNTPAVVAPQSNLKGVLPIVLIFLN